MLRLLKLIGYQPDPENRPWLWFVGRAHVAIGYPCLMVWPSVYVRRYMHAPRRLQVIKIRGGRVHAFWDRDRAALWGGE